MSTEPHPIRLFTVEEANAALPLVRAITNDLVRLSRDVIEREERLEQLRSNRGSSPERNDPYREELAQIEQDLENDKQSLHEYVHELRELGVEPKNCLEGIVDFPATLDGRLVSLCWQLGEPELLYWHELDGGFRGRQPLTANSTALGGSATGAFSEDDAPESPV